MAPEPMTAEAPPAPASASPVPPAPGFVLHGVPRALYGQLRALEANERVRMTYLDGTLVFMSPEYIHDSVAQRLGQVVRVVAAASGIEVAGTGTTTLRRGGEVGDAGAAQEPDNGYYVGPNERKIRGKTAIDLDVDPPPDLAIEVDNTSGSSLALAVYARLGVPEVWRYDVRRHRLWFGRLDGEGYSPADRSLCLPRLTVGLVLQALDRLDDPSVGESTWLLWLLDWARALPGPPGG